MNTVINKELLFCHFDGRTTPMQVELLREWLRTPDNQQTYYHWLQEWEHRHPQVMADPDAAFALFRQMIESAPNPVATSQLPVSNRRLPRAYVVAASITVLLVLLGYLTRSYWSVRTIATNYGEVRSIRLDDGSTVILNANSTLRLPRFGFGNRSREVRLTGEAFFSVRHQPDNQRFIVRTTHGFDVIVHGTEFNVSAYTHRANVMLHTGKVQIDYPAGSSRKQLMLEPGDLVNLNQPGLPRLTHPVQPEVYSAWTEHRFVFNDMTLREFGQLLTDTYGLTVEMPESLTKRTLVGSFQANSADELVQIVAELLDLSVSRNASTVVLEERKTINPD